VGLPHRKIRGSIKMVTRRECDSAVSDVFVTVQTVNCDKEIVCACVCGRGVKVKKWLCPQLRLMETP
jgi:hypothetical protein